MRRRAWFSISLAAKCRYLFGAAVLFIIAVAYFVPWTLVNSLTSEVYRKDAQRVAVTAQLTMDPLNWAESQQRLTEHWSEYVRMAALPEHVKPPRLIPIDAARNPLIFHQEQFVAQSVDAFEQDSNRENTYKRQDDGATFRLAWPVRSLASEARPSALLGIIDVQVPVRRDALESWNLVAFIVSGATAGLLSILVFYLITQKLILSPVRDLRGVAEQVASGDLDVRSTIATGDEFEELAQTFNDMLAHLKITQDELRTINKSLDVRLGELAETNVALFESNRLKSEFLSNVSHELRTPLVSIIGFAELLRDAAANPAVDRARWTRYAENILISARMLLDIINDLLDLAKIEAGKLELHISEFSLHDVCESLIDFIRPLADKKNLTLEVQIADALPPFRSDSGKIKQILYNLLSNAVKFTPPGGRVGLSVEPASSAAVVSSDPVELAVSDTGPGIAPEDQSLIFEKFRQLDASKTREFGGTGLGLAITRELAAMLGGAIHVRSEVGRGSRFTVTLPAQAPHDVHRPLVALT